MEDGGGFIKKKIPFGIRYSRASLVILGLMLRE